MTGRLRLAGSIRSRLILLILSLFIPVLLVIAFIYHDRFQGRKALEVQINLELARAVGETFGEFVFDVLRQELAVGMAFAMHPDFATQEMRRFLAQNQKEYPVIVDYMWVSPGGVVLSSGNGKDIGMDLSGRECFRRMASGEEWVVGNIQRGEEVKQPFFVISRSIRDESGAMLGAVVAIVDPARLRETIAFEREGNGSLMIFDANGTVVYRHPEIDLTREDRESLAHHSDVIRALGGEEVTHDELPGLDGRERIFAFTPIKSIGWIAGASRPVKEVMAPVYANFFRSALLTLLIMIGSLIAALLIARSLIRPARLLREHTVALGRGEADHPAQVDGVSEFEELAAALDTMAGELSAKEAQARLLACAAQRRADEVEAIFSALMHPMVVYDESGAVVNANPAAIWAYGLNPVGVKHDSFMRELSFLDPDGNAVPMDRLPSARAIDGYTVVGERLAVTNARGRKLIIMVSASPLVMEGKPSGAVVIWHDVTEREKLFAEVELQREKLKKAHDELEIRVQERTSELKDAYESLRLSEEHFRRTFDQSPIGAAIVTLDYRFSRVNEALCRITGYSCEELESLTFPDITHPEDIEADVEMVKRLTRGEMDQYDMEKRYIRKGGEIVWVHLYVRLLRDASGHPLYFIPMMEDITARKKAEEELRAYTARLERSNEELREFAFVASHDLQEPLRKIQVFCDRLKSSYIDVLDQAGRDQLVRMQNSAGRMQSLILALLEYSKIAVRSKTFSRVDLRKVTEEAMADLDILIEESGARIELGHLDSIEVEKIQMRRLFRNLISNSLKFRGVEPPLVRIRSEVAGETCTIYVEDNGIGFDEKYLDRVFRPFQCLHARDLYEGTGMGLAVCRKIVEHHNGSITARSKPGEGTIFIVTLPVRQSA